MKDTSIGCPPGPQLNGPSTDLALLQSEIFGQGDRRARSGSARECWFRLEGRRNRGTNDSHSRVLCQRRERAGRCRRCKCEFGGGCIPQSRGRRSFAGDYFLQSLALATDDGSEYQSRIDRLPIMESMSNKERRRSTWRAATAR